ncbi:hypothetical protein ABB37_06471 [Leptomonas pyrrhocoris]|uniref:Uncharacterized protein n=1 Tax=Leptomonas pyrrhocoris TaxID=157538 RepID=A0A0N0DU30_LEPPY|nr:hypothetical protein ABB37_06471 [Leptomonas pyrrhocoris]KPA78342.1 hypothetical protein ABB37_06471 [Leptomonas pyrrhocoris]|eukprot:XP_015656781.1 hypothetical protein ABB37_06471 [Leptomonas pyrrhocoris]
MYHKTHLAASGSAAALDGGAENPERSSGRQREVPHYQSCTNSSRNVLRTCFYFTVFFSNNPPIFHSNRIPADLLGITPSPVPSVGASTNTNAACVEERESGTACAALPQHRWQSIFADPALNRQGSAAAASRTEIGSGKGGGGGTSSSSAAAFLHVGDFRAEAAATDEVPQQTLQTVAFPTAFGGMGGGVCPLPVRKLSSRARPPRPASPPLRSTAANSAATDAAVPSSFTQGRQQQEEQRQDPRGPQSAYADTDAMKDSGSKRNSAREAGTTPNLCDDCDLANPTTYSSDCRSSIGPSASTANNNHKSTLHSLSNNGGKNGSSSTNPPPTTGYLSSYTLPLTTTSSPDTTTTTATTTTTTTAANALVTNTATSDVPVRFQPTFPVVRWEDEDEAGDDDKGNGAADGNAGEQLGSKETLRRREEVEEQDKCGKTRASESAVEATAAPGRAPVRARRPRPKISALTPSPTAAASPQPNASSVRRQVPPSLTCLAHAEGPLSPPPPARTSTAAASTAPTALTQQTPPSTTTQRAPPPTAAVPAGPPPAATAADTTATTTTTTTMDAPPTAVTQEGPPWNMRVEEVRSAKGDLRYYRLILAVPFAALITSHTGMLHSMQTRNAAAALVVDCPPSGVHFRFFLNHVDVLRSVLHRTTEFAIRTVQRFFALLFSPTQKSKGPQQQQQVLKDITKRLEMHAEASDTYRSVKAELATALHLLLPLPLLAPSTAGWVVPVLMQSSFASARKRAGLKGPRSAATAAERRSNNGDGGASAAIRWLKLNGSSATSVVSAQEASAWRTPSSSSSSSVTSAPRPPLSDILYEATAFLCEYSESFTSAFVCGLLSLAEEGGGGGGGRRGLHPRADVVSTDPPLLHAPSSAAAVVDGNEDSRDTSVAAAAAAAYAPLPGIDGATATTATPDWLSAYASYFHSVAAAPEQSTLHDKADAAEAGGRTGDGWIQLSRPANAPQLIALHPHSPAADDGDGNDEDAYLRTHVSASTVSSVTPVLSPLTVDVEVRHQPGRLPRGRNLSTPSLSALIPTAVLYPNSNRDSNTSIGGTTANPTAAAFAATPSAAQLYMVSAETSHAATVALSNTTAGGGGGGDHHRSGSSTGDLANASGLSRQQTSTAASAITSVHSATATAAAAVTAPSASSPAAPPSHPPTSTRPSVAPATPVRAPSATITSTATTATAPAGDKEDEYWLHRGRLSRVVIFTQDALLARRLLLVAAFLWNDGCSSDEGKGGPSALKRAATNGTVDAADAASGFHDDDARRMYETAVAAAVPSADFANVPIQWVPGEFSEARLTALCSRFSPENTLLVVAPRQLQCRRVRLRKHVAGTTVLVEQQAGKEARIRSPAFPFQCSISKQTVLLPDPTVTTLLREARSLHQGSHGAVDFAEVFQRMVKWLYWQSAAAVLRKREVHVQVRVAAALQAAAADTAGASAMSLDRGGGSGSGVVLADGGGLSRYASVDLRWPSRSVSAMGSRVTSPASITPIAFLSGFPYLHAASSTASAAPCFPAVKSSAEESLLPGSRGGASAEWAYGATNAAATTSPFTAGEGFTAPCAAVAVDNKGERGLSVSAPTASTLLVSHGLLQPPSAFVTASPTSATTPLKSPSLRFLSWLRPSPTASAAPHFHPVLSPTTLGQLSAGDGGQLQRLLCEDDDFPHA